MLTQETKFCFVRSCQRSKMNLRPYFCTICILGRWAKDFQFSNFANVRSSQVNKTFISFFVVVARSQKHIVVPIRLKSGRNNTVIPKKASERICLSLWLHECLKIQTIVPQCLFQHAEPKPKAINRKHYANFVGNPSVQTEEVVKIHFREK